jgi:LPS export ABC transporter protein LptC
MQDFVLYQSSKGRVDLKLEADSVTSGDPGTSEYHLQGVRCFLYGDDNQHSVITGGQALFVARQKLITIVDDVVINGNDGEFMLETDALRYFTSYKVMKTATPVVLKRDKIVISGNSLMYNMKTKAFRITGDVQCEL